MTDAPHTPSQVTRGISLALSGGGFRASLFHLGVIRFLKAAGLLSSVRRIYSVSGGSILAAHLVQRWPSYCRATLVTRVRLRRPLSNSFALFGLVSVGGYKGEPHFSCLPNYCLFDPNLQMPVVGHPLACCSITLMHISSKRRHPLNCLAPLTHLS
jgi:hypothetical protein